MLDLFELLSGWVLAEGESAASATISALLGRSKGLADWISTFLLGVDTLEGVRGEALGLLEALLHWEGSNRGPDPSPAEGESKGGAAEGSGEQLPQSGDPGQPEDRSQRLRLLEELLMALPEAFLQVSFFFVYSKHLGKKHGQMESLNIACRMICPFPRRL